MEMPVSPFVEMRDGAYFVAGTRISLETVAYGVRRGEALEQILEDFPSIRSREKLQGVIDYIQAHPQEIEEYLAEGVRLWNELEKQNPPEIEENLRRYREARGRKTA